MKKLLSQPTSYFTKQPSSGEWEESQQNLLCTWWFLLAFVLVEKGGCVLSTRKLKLTPCITLVISFLNSSSSRLQSAAADWVYLSAGRCASAYGTHCAGLASGELSGFHRKGPVASKFARLKPPGLSRLDDVGDLSQAPSKTKVNHRTQGSAAGDLGRPSTETNRQGSVKSFSKRLKKCVKAGGGHFEHLKWMQMLDKSFIVSDV